MFEGHFDTHKKIIIIINKTKHRRNVLCCIYSSSDAVPTLEDHHIVAERLQSSRSIETTDSGANDNDLLALRASRRCLDILRSGLQATTIDEAKLIEEIVNSVRNRVEFFLTINIHINRSRITLRAACRPPFPTPITKIFLRSRSCEIELTYSEQQLQETILMHNVQFIRVPFGKWTPRLYVHIVMNICSERMLSLLSD